MSPSTFLLIDLEDAAESVCLTGTQEGPYGARESLGQLVVEMVVSEDMGELTSAVFISLGIGRLIL